MLVGMMDVCRVWPRPKPVKKTTSSQAPGLMKVLRIRTARNPEATGLSAVYIHTGPGGDTWDGQQGLPSGQTVGNESCLTVDSSHNNTRRLDLRVAGLYRI